MKKAPFSSHKNFWATDAEHWVRDFSVRATKVAPAKGWCVHPKVCVSLKAPPQAVDYFA